MVSINIILVASLVLHLLHRPYLKARAVLGHVPSAQAQWNNMEAGLLIAALCIVALTTLMVANEIHWARSESWCVAPEALLSILVAGSGAASAGL